MPTNLTTLCSGKRFLALLAAASLGALIVATTSAEARNGVGRPGVGVGRVGSGLGYRPGVGVGRAGLGVRGWRGGLGSGWGYGAAALTGAALYGAANSYGYGYGEPYGYSNSGLYSYSPAAGYAESPELYPPGLYYEYIGYLYNQTPGTAAPSGQ